MDIFIGVIIFGFGLILSLVLLMSALSVINGEKNATTKGVLIWILGVIILLILIALKADYISDTGITFDQRRT